MDFTLLWQTALKCLLQTMASAVFRPQIATKKKNVPRIAMKKRIVPRIATVKSLNFRAYCQGFNPDLANWHTLQSGLLPMF
jgi:hypothetical protein